MRLMSRSSHANSHSRTLNHRTKRFGFFNDKSSRKMPRGEQYAKVPCTPLCTPPKYKNLGVGSGKNTQGGNYKTRASMITFRETFTSSNREIRRSGRGGYSVNSG